MQSNITRYIDILSQLSLQLFEIANSILCWFCATHTISTGARTFQNVAWYEVQVLIIKKLDERNFGAVS